MSIESHSRFAQIHVSYLHVVPSGLADGSAVIAVRLQVQLEIGTTWQDYRLPLVWSLAAKMHCTISTLGSKAELISRDCHNISVEPIRDYPAPIWCDNVIQVARHID